MLNNYLYKVRTIESGEGRFCATVDLLPECDIYKGHFEGYPITPGVCLAQIAVELVESVTGVSADIASAKNIKFLKPVIPSETGSLDVSATFDGSVWRVEFTAGETVHAKMSFSVR